MELIVKNKKYQTKSGWAAIRNYCALHKPPVEFYEAFDHFKELNFDKPSVTMLDDFALLLWCFIDRGCKINNVENDLTVEDMIDWIGESKNISPVVVLLYESFGVDVSQPGDIINEKDKKHLKKNA